MSRTSTATRELDAPEKLDMLMLAAVHEVSHLYVARVSGIKSSWIKVRRKLMGGVDGWTQPDLLASGWKPDPDEPEYLKPTQEQIRAYQLCCQGGAAGVKYWFARTWQATHVNGVRWDYGSGCDMKMARFCAGLCKMSISAGHVESLRLVHQNWPRIARGAQLLHRRRSMPAKKV